MVLEVGRGRAADIEGEDDGEGLGGATFEDGDRLWRAVIGDGEVGLFEPADQLAASVFDGDQESDETDVCFEGDVLRRGERGKVTKPTKPAPASTAASTVSGVDSPQILTSIVMARLS